MIVGGRLEPRTADGSSLALSILLWPAAIGIALFLLYLPLFVHAMQVWSADYELSFGFIVPPIVAALTWQRRRRIGTSISAGAWSGLPLLLSGLAVLLLATRLNIHALAASSLPLTVCGAAMYLYGLKVARLLIFPTVLLGAALGLYHGLLDSVGFSMQYLTAAATVDAATVLGVSVHRSGVDLFAPHFHFVVAQACSGMDSLLALLCMASIVVGVARASLLRRAILVALILPIILLSNTARVTAVIVLSQSLGQRVVQEPSHGLLSATVFVCSSLLFAASVAALKCVPRPAVTQS